jgi:hypothetical protein
LPYRGPPRRRCITGKYVLTSRQRQNPRRGVWVCDGGVETFCSQRSRGSLSGHQTNEAVGQVGFAPRVACSGTVAHRVLDRFSCSSTFHAGGPRRGLKPAIDFPFLAGLGSSAVCPPARAIAPASREPADHARSCRGSRSRNHTHEILFRRSSAWPVAPRRPGRGSACAIWHTCNTTGCYRSPTHPQFPSFFQPSTWPPPTGTFHFAGTGSPHTATTPVERAPVGRALTRLENYDSLGKTSRPVAQPG